MRAGIGIVLGLALAACHQQTASPPRPPASGPVNPDPGVTTYSCMDGQRITAGYPDPQTAVVTYKDHAYTLKLAHSADGARYTGYGLQWWIRGSHAEIVALKAGEETTSAPGLDCVAEETPPAAINRTSLTAADPKRA
ncbi:MAG TPA: MliC family protein [Phenylobacterium sp.]|nr:MliC family protein [Phenylobacterium sp.]